jgi:hypothetical protein
MGGEEEEHRRLWGLWEEEGGGREGGDVRLGKSKMRNGGCGKGLLMRRKGQSYDRIE